MTVVQYQEDNEFVSSKQQNPQMILSKYWSVDSAPLNTDCDYSLVLHSVEEQHYWSNSVIFKCNVICKCVWWNLNNVDWSPYFFRLYFNIWVCLLTISFSQSYTWTKACQYHIHSRPSFINIWLCLFILLFCTGFQGRK